MTVIHFATLKPKPDIAPNRAAIVGIKQTTARKPSQLKKNAMILENPQSLKLTRLKQQNDTYKAIRNVQSVPTSILLPDTNQVVIAG